MFEMERFHQRQRAPAAASWLLAGHGAVDLGAAQDYPADPFDYAAEDAALG